MMIRDERARDTFGKLLCMLASDQSGERAAAALKATELLRAQGLDWHAVAALLSKPDQQTDSTRPRARARPEQRRAQTMPHNTEAFVCLKSDVGWKDHEIAFLKQMRTLSREPSEKQRAWLAFLLNRANTEGQEAA